MKTEFKKQNRDKRERYSFDKKLSIIKLLAADNALKINALFIAMLIAEIAIFVICGMRKNPEYIEIAVYYSRLPIYAVMGVSFAVLCFILSNTLTARVGKPVYTVQRLLVDERCFFKINCFYNTLAFIAYLGFQALAILLMILIFNQSKNGNIGPQNLFMALYRTPFFHSVVPMENWYFTARNMLFVCGLGIWTAIKSQRSRDGENAFGLYFVAAVVMITFIYDPLHSFPLGLRLRDFAAIVIVGAAAFCGMIMGTSYRKEKWDRDEITAFSEYEK